MGGRSRERSRPSISLEPSRTALNETEIETKTDGRETCQLSGANAPGVDLIGLADLAAELSAYLVGDDGEQYPGSGRP
jgi:hypothetical protein